MSNASVNSSRRVSFPSRDATTIRRSRPSRTSPRPTATSPTPAFIDTQKQQLAYHDIRAPFAGIVGDVPVHLGDYVSTTTVLTTVDEIASLEAYIYIPN